ncbi:MAG: hypothetical protein ACRDJW_19350 [Thermomicrobiales bacterium]
MSTETDGRRPRAVGEPRFFPHRHPSRQPFLLPLEETDWHPAQPVAPYRPRRTRSSDERQEPLFPGHDEASVG